MTREEFDKLDHLSLTFNYRCMITYGNDTPCDFETIYINGVSSYKVHNIYDIDSECLMIDTLTPSFEKKKLIKISNFINLINDGYIRLIYSPTDIRNFKLLELTC